MKLNELGSSNLKNSPIISLSNLYKLLVMISFPTVNDSKYDSPFGSNEALINILSWS